MIASDTLQEFRKYRERMTKRILNAGNLGMKRFFAIDSRAYEKGALDTWTQKLLGLVAFIVLRCKDCITYHVICCSQEGVKEEEFFEALNIALVVDGSITIPALASSSRDIRSVQKHSVEAAESETLHQNMGRAGFEPATFRLSAECSSQAELPAPSTKFNYYKLLDGF